MTEHAAIVPAEGGVPPFCACGVVGGRGEQIDGVPLLADHLREVGADGYR
nr:MAG TPA_asm: hypothetical protein [Caudoviricetes sp.]